MSVAPVLIRETVAGGIRPTSRKDTCKILYFASCGDEAARPAAIDIDDVVIDASCSTLMDELLLRPEPPDPLLTPRLVMTRSLEEESVPDELAAVALFPTLDTRCPVL